MNNDFFKKIFYIILSYFYIFIKQVIYLPYYFYIFVKQAFFPEKVELSNGEVVLPKKSVVPYVILLIIGFIFISAYATNFSVSVIIDRGEQFFVIVRKMMFPPDWTFFIKVSGPLLDTIKMSILGSIIGAMLAFPVAVLASSNVNNNQVLLFFTRLFLSLLRTMPALVYALILTYILGFGTFAGTVAIAIFTFAIVSKMLFEIIENVDMSPFEALQSTGASRPKSFVAALMPQILPSYFSIALYSFEINVRYAAILGYVGAGGIGLLISEKLGWRDYDKVGSILLALLVTVITIETTSRMIRKRLI